MLIPQAHAQAAGATASGGLAQFVSIAPLILIFVAFYFLMIRPQQRRMKALQASVAAVKKGDTVVEVEIAANVRVRVVKATLAEVTPLGGAKPAND